MQCLRASAIRLLSRRPLARGKATLPDLPYDYNALEPVISAEIVQVHHGKHHNAYVNNFNAAEEKLAEAVQKGDVVAQVALQNAFRFNAGGHVNHSIMWQNLCNAKDSGEPSKELAEALKRDFGSVDAMKTQVDLYTSRQNFLYDYR